MSWEDFRFLLAIERGGGVAGAARLLEVDKATVRRRIEALEEGEGQPLVVRRASGWTVNEAGARLARAAEAMEKAVEAARRDLTASEETVVRVTAPVWFARRVIMPALGALHAEHPELTLRLLATNEMLDVAQREADIAVRNIKPARDGIAFRRVGELGNAIYASRSYLEERGEPQGRSGWSEHHLLAFDERVSYAQELQWLADSGATVVFRATDPEVLLDATVNGMGIAVLPCLLADAEPELVRIDPEVARCSIYACLPEELRRHQPVRSIADWLAKLFEAKHKELAGE